MDDWKRKAKEEHVSGHSGTTPLECQKTLVVTMVSYTLWKALAKRFPSLVEQSARTVVVDFAVLALPFLVAVMTPWLDECLMVTSIMAVAASLLPAQPAKRKQKDVERNQKALSPFFLPFMVPVRAYLQLVTIIVILAVDFKAFPTRFAKTETYGTSLMDLGVGMFIFTGGIVAGPRLQTSASDRSTALRNLGRTLRTCTPTLILGVVRMVVTKSVNYQEHVSEYGVHWNFFLTLGLIPIFISIAQVLAPNINMAALGCLVMATYTYALEATTLQSYILTAPRNNIISENREGLCSFFGYLTIYLLAAAIGTRLQTYARRGLQRMLPSIVLELSALAAVCYGLTFLLTDVLEIPVSRRMANVSYSVWVLAPCLVQVAGCALVDLLYGGTRIPVLFQAVNRNQLVVFLLGNVLTGLTNMSVNTLDVPDALAIGIVAGYALIVGGVAVLLDHYNLILKF